MKVKKKKQRIWLAILAKCTVALLSWLWRRRERELGTGLFARRIKELLAAKRKTSLLVYQFFVFFA
jgi:hypothetical protein